MQKERRPAEAKRVREGVEQRDRYALRARVPEYPIARDDGRCTGGPLWGRCVRTPGRQFC
jgi:hypothetical protein